MLYGLVESIQHDLIEKYCFKACGKVLCGAIFDELVGGMWPCRQDTCPYEDETSEVIGEVNGETCKIRKLKEYKSGLL